MKFRRPHSTYKKVVQGKCPLHFLHFNGVVCSKTLFSNTSALTNSLLFRVNSTCKGSRTPRLLEHFWVPILGASCSNKLFVGTLRPSQKWSCHQRFNLLILEDWYAVMALILKHKHKQIFPVTARVGGVSRSGGQGSPDRWPGVKSLCAVCRTQQT